MSQELLVIENLNPLDVFKEGGIGPILSMIEAEVSAEVPDTTTAKGRKIIASNAYKVSQSKSLLEKMGKALADNLNAKLKPINSERKQARDALDALKDKIRCPLNEWEAEECRKKEEIEAKATAKLIAIVVNQDHEIALLMNEVWDRQLEDINRQAKEQELLDLANKKAEQAAHEKRIVEEATAEANRKLIEAEDRAKQQVEQAKLDLEKAARDKDAAVQQEINNRAMAVAREASELKAREDNIAHVGSVRKSAKEALIYTGGISEEQAKNIVMAIHSGRIPQVLINY